MRRSNKLFDIWWALQEWWFKLQRGDPVALGLLGFLLLLLAIAGVIWWIDRQSQRKPKSKPKSKSRSSGQSRSR